VVDKVNVKLVDNGQWGVPLSKPYHKGISGMWKHFLQFSIDKTKVKCKYCDKILNLGSGLSTGKLIRHMMNVHRLSMKNPIVLKEKVSYLMILRL